jgi:hypothetical protein
VDITTQGGQQLFWSDSDASGAGKIVSYNSAGNYGLFTTNGGNIVMAGGAGIASPTGLAYGDFGVNLAWATLNAGTGDITMRGSSVSTGDYGIGLRFFTAASLTGRNITLVGQGATNTSTRLGNWGVGLEAASITGSGTISVTGTGGGSGSTGADNYGVLVFGSTITGTGSGAVTLTGTGGGKSGSGTNNDGVNVSGGSTVKSASGTLTLIGTAGLNGSSEGIAIQANAGITNTLGDASTQTGGITLRANSMYFNSTNTNLVLGTGTLALEPLTANTTVGLGTGSGTLSLGSALFSGSTRVFSDGFSGITIGNSTAGAIAVGGANTFSDSVALVTGGNITLNSGATITSSTQRNRH